MCPYLLAYWIQISHILQRSFSAIIMFDILLISLCPFGGPADKWDSITLLSEIVGLLARNFVPINDRFYILKNIE